MANVSVEAQRQQIHIFIQYKNQEEEDVQRPGSIWRNVFTFLFILDNWSKSVKLLEFLYSVELHKTI